MKYVLALDQGTTSSRAILYDRDGTIRGLAQREFEQIYPRSGWVEHDPEEIWASQMSVAVEALSRANAARGTSLRSALPINAKPQSSGTARPANRCTTRLCGKTAAPQRSAPDLRAQGFEERISQKTGLLIDAYFSATKILWILENVKGAREKANAGELAFGTVDSWLIWNLTSGKLHAIDATNASRTMLFNIHEGDGTREFWMPCAFRDSLLPEVRPSSGKYAHVSTSLGLEDVLIAGVAGDQQAALFGQACFCPGMAKCTYGTGAFLLQTLGEESEAIKEPVADYRRVEEGQHNSNMRWKAVSSLPVRLSNGFAMDLGSFALRKTLRRLL